MSPPVTRIANRGLNILASRYPHGVLREGEDRLQQQTRLIYVDDSGDDQAGWIVFAWHEFDQADWHAVLEHRLTWRKRLYRNQEFQIPASQHLHTADFLGLRNSLEVAANPDLNLDAGTRRRKQVQASRVKVVEQALHTLRSDSALTFGYVARRLKEGDDPGHHKGDLYKEFVLAMDAELARNGDRGLIIMDGVGDDGRYTRAHRELRLATRALVEDPLFQRQHTSQMVQMSDLIAYAAYQHEYRADGKKFAWDWWTNFLEPKSSPLTGRL
jgi:hypothetical protein